MKRLELAARTKLINLCLCHKQSGKEQVQGKVEKINLNLVEILGVSYQKI